MAHNYQSIAFSLSSPFDLFPQRRWLRILGGRFLVEYQRNSQYGIPHRHTIKIKAHTVRTVRSQSFSCFSTPPFTCGGSGFQVLETCSKHSRTASMLGRFCTCVDQHKHNISHKSSVNHVPFTPSGLSGRLPSVTFRATIWSLNCAKGGSPVSTSWITIPRA
jgi:hypothetical protein